MPLNDRKIIRIILEECDKMQARCPGYQDELREVITEVIAMERQHQVKSGNIQKKINDKFNATARFLATSRRSHAANEESGQ